MEVEWQIQTLDCQSILDMVTVQLQAKQMKFSNTILAISPASAKQTPKKICLGTIIKKKSMVEVKSGVVEIWE